jgi:hypothetical protein
LGRKNQFDQISCHFPMCWEDLERNSFNHNIRIFPIKKIIEVTVRNKFFNEIPVE